MSSDFEKIVAEIERLKSRVAELEAGRVGVDLQSIPSGLTASSARLIALARVNPEAAKAEAKRLARLDNIERRNRRKPCSSNIDAA